MKRFCSIFLLAAMLVFPVKGQLNYTDKTRLNNGWEFLRQDLGSIWESVRPVEAGTSEAVPLWSEVTLPHCFNAEDAVDPDKNYYQGPGWYRQNLTINNPYTSGRVLLHFEGAGQKTEVYVYTQKVASHVGGYDEWTVDITDAVKWFSGLKDASRFGGKIPVSIRCDNSRDTEMIPSDLSDFNIYGGIYRYLNLVYTPSVAFSTVQIDSKTDVKGTVGNVSVKVGLTNYSNEKDATLILKLYSPTGRLSYKDSVQTAELQQQQVFDITVKKPELWSTDQPQLYSCELTVLSKAGKITVKENLGFRHFEFREGGPFFLNGKRLLLQGTHRHEDHAGVGAAMTEEMIRKEMQLIRSMGANFIRLGHYQQSRIVLDECDKLGLLVWEEIPWCRGGLGGKAYQDQAKRMLTNMIQQHRHHPSIILWGLGNENDWPNDFPEFDKEKIRSFMKELNSLSHTLDPSRMTSIRRCDFCKDIVDVYSPSIWAGWYRGIYTDYKRVSEHEMQQVKRFFHAEWGGDSHAGRHAEDPYKTLDKISAGSADERAGDASLYGGTARASKDGDWSESYICDLIDWHLKEQETMPNLTGSAYWVFKDFSTPVRPENPVPYVNQKGVVERDLTPKEAYYVFQSYWSKKPVIHIYGHSWPIRWGKPDELKTLKVYSNCSQVELFLNGKSLGVKKRNSADFPAAGLRWTTTLSSGKNTLYAVGKSGKTITSDSIQFDYETRAFGKEAAIDAKIMEETNDYVWVEAQLKDNNGVPCLESKNYIYFNSVGAGKLVINQGTSSGSSKVQAYNGRARIKLLKGSDKSIISISSDGLKTVFIQVSGSNPR